MMITYMKDWRDEACVKEFKCDESSSAAIDKHKKFYFCIT